jgi:hypothetical protein
MPDEVMIIFFQQSSNAPLQPECYDPSPVDCHKRDDLLNNKPVFHLHGCLAVQVNEQLSALANRNYRYAIQSASATGAVKNLGSLFK